MRKKQEQQSETLNESALGDISVLSPSQKREQERLRKEEETKKAAEKEKRRQAAAKRKAVEEAAIAEVERQERNRIIRIVICLCTIVGGIIMAFVGLIDSESSPKLILYGLGLAIAAVVTLVKNL